MTLDEMLKNAEEFAIKTFHETGSVSPMWVAESANNERFVIATPWGSREEKEMVVQGLRALFKEKKVQRFSFIVEAWVVQPSDGKIPESMKLGASLSTHPERRELLMIRAEDKAKSVSSIYYILRPEHGKPKLVKGEFPTEGESGQMVGLLREQVSPKV